MNSAMLLPKQVANPLLEYKETELLIIKSQKGCLESRNKLVEANIKLVLSMVHQFTSKNKSYAFDDLFQIGVIGLMKSVDGFEINRGFRFSTFAATSIKNEISNFLRGNYTVKVKRETHENSWKIKAFWDDFVQKNQREPKFEEIMGNMDIDRDSLIEALGVSNDLISLSTGRRFHDDSNEQLNSLEDMIVDESASMERWVDSQYLKDIVEELGSLEKKIIQLKYFHDKTQTEIGDLLSLPQWKVSRIERSAIKNLKSKL